MKQIIINKKGSMKSLKENINSALNDLNYRILESESDDLIIASKGVSLVSYGEKVYIEIEKNSNGFKIEIESESQGIQIFDWGKNGINEEEIADELKKRLT